MIEIERKFLVTSVAYQEQATLKERIVQGFLNTDKERTVRVRIKGELGFLTVKGKSNDAGTVRFEWEKKISVSDAEQLLLICEPGIIDKVRYNVPIGSHIYEIDEFHGDNEGLVVAEVELQSENQNFKKPLWLGEEVTGIVKYYNSQLSKHPYKLW
ncbi:CYTH domain-containing protein [Zobellia alginiliquefaciens]|uniref:CYTH domain-containing protein n=1 Tax=Zobellia alginiliquefaciens TaxID=3032586 RepID=UPI0023E47484|nr:CYTH domain-containing protein [Zobellia alginiliquefaciens]